MKFNHAEIIEMLSAEGDEMQQLLDKAHAVRVARAGEGIYLRGLIEYSNQCRKNCLYCGIRKDMPGLERYTLTHDQVVGAAAYALREGYGSVVIQAGEITSKQYTDAVERIVRDVKALTLESVGAAPPEGERWQDTLGITLSLGEQSLDTYRRWFGAGATRYLLRIEASDRKLFSQIHPRTIVHSYDDRLRAIMDLRRAGFQVGTGVMIGLPGQTPAQLAGDLTFMERMGIDMCGMGPYIECAGTPLAGGQVPPLQWRMDMTLKMVAVLRLMMPDINIAATTALEAIDPQGRARALRSGANVMMPNITPQDGLSGYKLYDNKPEPGCVDLSMPSIRRGVPGDSKHFTSVAGKSE